MQLLNNVKPVLYMTDEVKLKMDLLVKESNKEVGWHGLVMKAGLVYVIYDILLFPQKVTGSTVNPDESEYYEWMEKLTDTQINNMRFHGHSHVNMGVSPSGVDMQFREDLVKNVEDYYIFMIVNKKGNYEISIYDKALGVVMDESDITFRIGTPASYNDAEAWVAENIKNNVKEEKLCSTTLKVSTYSHQPTNYGTNKYMSSAQVPSEGAYASYWDDWE